MKKPRTVAGLFAVANYKSTHPQSIGDIGFYNII
jgi:hypothetical protein